MIFCQLLFDFQNTIIKKAVSSMDFYQKSSLRKAIQIYMYSRTKFTYDVSMNVFYKYAYDVFGSLPNLNGMETIQMLS